LPFMADRRRQVVAATHAQVVAGVAGQEAGLRQTRVEPEFLAEFHHAGIQALWWLNRLDRLLRGSGRDKQQGRGPGDQIFHKRVHSLPRFASESRKNRNPLQRRERRYDNAPIATSEIYRAYEIISFFLSQVPAASETIAPVHHRPKAE